MLVLTVLIFCLLRSVAGLPCQLVELHIDVESGESFTDLNCLEENGKAFAIRGDRTDELKGNFRKQMAGDGDAINGVFIDVNKEDFDERRAELVIRSDRKIRYEKRAVRSRSRPPRKLLRGRGLAQANGISSVLAVKSKGNDSPVVSSSVGVLSESVFGGPNDAVNLKSQMNDCSHGKLQMTMAQGTNIPVGGVAEATVDIPSYHANSGTFQNLVLDALTTQGINYGTFDHVMICVPPNMYYFDSTSSFIAYGYINSWLTVYSDKWCTYVSAGKPSLSTSTD